MTGDFKESNTSAIELHGDDPDAVEVFMHWLIHKQLPDIGSLCKLDSKSTKDECSEHAQRVKLTELRTFVLGDKYSISGLQKAILATSPLTRWSTSSLVVGEIFATNPGHGTLNTLQTATVHNIAFAGRYLDKDSRRSLPDKVDDFMVIAGFPEAFTRLAAGYMEALDSESRKIYSSGAIKEACEIAAKAKDVHFKGLD